MFEIERNDVSRHKNRDGNSRGRGRGYASRSSRYDPELPPADGHDGYGGSQVFLI